MIGGGALVHATRRWAFTAALNSRINDVTVGAKT